MIKITDNFQVNKPAPIDDRLGPFASTALALSSIELDRRYIGLTVIVDDGTGAVDYWFKDGVTNGDLEAKSTGGGGGATWGSITGTLTNQTDLNTALSGKFNNPTGTTAQYLDGLGTPTDFPTAGQAGTLVRQVRNETGATLAKGTVVYISGASGNKALVSKAIATGDGTSAQTFGVVQSDITNNQNGFVVVRGDLAGLNTSAFTEGAQLYLSSTTAGEYTSTKQYAPNHLVYIAIVTRSHVNQGSIEVAIQNGYELDELHNVQAQNPSNKNSIFFDSSDNQWKARAVSATDIDPNVSNTEFSYLDGVSSSIQTQINGKVTANGPITGSTRTKITYDSKGLVTAGADLAIADLPSPTPIGYCSPLASIVSGGVITETQITTLTIPAGAFKTGDNILLTLWGTRTTGASSGVNSTVVLRVTNTAGPQILSNITGNRHQNFTITGKVLSDTSIIWWQNSPTTASATTTVPSLASSGFVISIGLIRVATTDEFTLYNTIVRKYS